MDPDDVGAAGSSIVLTARSGRAALKHQLEKLGYVYEKADLEPIYMRFLEWADEKKQISDDDLVSLIDSMETVSK